MNQTCTVVPLSYVYSYYFCPHVEVSRSDEELRSVVHELKYKKQLNVSDPPSVGLNQVSSQLQSSWTAGSPVDINWRGHLILLWSVSQTVVLGPGTGSSAVSNLLTAQQQQRRFIVCSFSSFLSLLSPSLIFSVEHTDSSCTAWTEYCNLVHLMNVNATLTLSTCSYKK